MLQYLQPQDFNRATPPPASKLCKKRTPKILQASLKSIKKLPTEKKDEQKKVTKDNEPDITFREINFVKKPKLDIFLPSWRAVELPTKLKKVRKEEVEEDLSDETFIRRHEEAEAEEVVLWDRWRKMREKEGKKIRGRSTLSGWRTPDLGQGAPRLRSQRVASTASSASSSSTGGRLSPDTVAGITGICVLAATPTKLSLHTPDTPPSSQPHPGSSSKRKREDIAEEDYLPRKRKHVEDSLEAGHSVRRIRRCAVKEEVTEICKENTEDANILNLNTSCPELRTFRVLKESNNENCNNSQQQRRYCNII